MTDNEQPPFAFGQTVYVPWASAYTETRVPCPVCFGKRFAVLTLGNGEQVPVECEMCGHGFEGPRGYVMAYTPTSGVRRVIVTGLAYERGAWVVYEDSNPYREDVFATPEEAEARRVLMHADAEACARRNFEEQFKLKKKSLTWKAGYHRREIADLRRKLEWHESKLRATPAPAVATPETLRAALKPAAPSPSSDATTGAPRE